MSSLPDELQTLIERRDWLAARIKAKQSVGWETQYDEREYRALCWAIPILENSRDAELKSEFTDEQRRRLSVEIQTWAENLNPALLSNVSTGALQDELHRRVQKALGDPRTRVSVGVTNACPHGQLWDDCPDCRH